mmetsp:Transcript_49348/g.143035  ORF Transcript_49348/g.143035 Transcript_49348/m.143035 type:complete len:148 (-) Transcript_49348:141-584(-)
MPSQHGSAGGPGMERTLLPVVGVGAAGWLIGAVSLSTLGLMGVGAGAGCLVGNMVLDKVRAQRRQKAVDNLHPALKVALEQWQAFLDQRLPGRQASQEEAVILFGEFAELQPSNAAQIQDHVDRHGGRLGTGRGLVASQQVRGSADV